MKTENKQPKRESLKLNKICDICADLEGGQGSSTNNKFYQLAILDSTPLKKFDPHPPGIHMLDPTWNLGLLNMFLKGYPLEAKTAPKN